MIYLTFIREIFQKLDNYNSFLQLVITSKSMTKLRTSKEDQKNSENLKITEVIPALKKCLVRGGLRALLGHFHVNWAKKSN